MVEHFHIFEGGSILVGINLMRTVAFVLEYRSQHFVGSNVTGRYTLEISAYLESSVRSNGISFST